MSRMLLIFPLLLLLVAPLAGAQPVDTTFTLALPTRPDGAGAMATLETVIIAMGAHLTSPKGENPITLDANWNATTHITASLGYTASSATPARELRIACLKMDGGAEALCRDVERRYRAQYR